MVGIIRDTGRPDQAKYYEKAVAGMPKKDPVAELADEFDDSLQIGSLAGRSSLGPWKQSRKSWDIIAFID